MNNLYFALILNLKIITIQQRLLESHLKSSPASKSADRRFVFLLLGGLILFVIAIAAVSVLVISLLVKIIQFITSG